ncbi:MAG TPA: helix-turn-helix transcriptional regulator [Saprospiraceae bacterium]|nr:helix-turn-helix transcriptional regulator [Saprospiraceae bacterium]
MPNLHSSTTQLSDREIEILKLLSEGLSSDEIGKEIHASKRTVDDYRQGLKIKANARNTAHLVAWALRNKIVE